MATGKRTPEATKKLIAKRFHKGEDPDTLAQEFGISVFTVRDYGKLFPSKTRRPKRRVIPKQPVENTRVSTLEKENAELRMELEVWKSAYKAVTGQK